MSQYETNPSLSDAVVKSRLLEKDCQIEPPADFPALFTCTYQGNRAIGCVYRCGVVCIVPDQLGPRSIPCMYTNMKWVEESEDIRDIVWEWGVIRFPDPPSSLRVIGEH